MKTKTSAEKLECQDCKATGPDVGETLCPFALEVFNEEQPCILCDKCWMERARDV